MTGRKKKEGIDVIRNLIRGNLGNSTKGQSDPFASIKPFPFVLKIKPKPLICLQGLGSLIHPTLPILSASALIIPVIHHVPGGTLLPSPVGLCLWHSSPHPPVNTRHGTPYTWMDKPPTGEIQLRPLQCSALQLSPPDSLWLFTLILDFLDTEVKISWQRRRRTGFSKGTDHRSVCLYFVLCTFFYCVFT